MEIWFTTYRALDWSRINAGYDWAIEANEKFKQLIMLNTSPATY
ncbi:MAG: hypothetical protein U0Z17_03510 [Bacteroidales bacterium]